MKDEKANVWESKMGSYSNDVDMVNKFETL